MVERSGAIGSDQPGRLRLPFRAALAAVWVGNRRLSAHRCAAGGWLKVGRMPT